VNSRDQIESIVAKPTTPSLYHRKIGLDQGKIRGVKLFDYLPRTRTLCNIYVAISKLDYARTTSYDTRQNKLQWLIQICNSKQLNDNIKSFVTASTINAQKCNN
jgi:hypothetical protein